MGLVWNFVGAYSVAIALAAWAFAALVYAQRPDRAQNRFLALALVFEGFYVFGGTGFIYLVDDPKLVYAFQWLNSLGFHGFMPAYLALLGTLETPLARPLRAAKVRLGLFATSGAWFAFMLARPYGYVSGVRRVDYAVWDASLGDDVVFFLVPLLVVFTFALLAAFDAWRRTPHGSLVRIQAALFLLAFGLRDVLAFLQYIPFVLARVGLGEQVPILPTTDIGLPRGFWFPTHVLLFHVLIAYGILKHQLFAIDLRIKWTIRQGTVAAAFIAVFFAASEGAQVFIQSETGSAVVGVAGAALLVFGLAPLQRVAERVANAAMPRVQDTAEYRTVRKREVYQAALENALPDGTMTEKERDILATLADQLGLSAGEARSLEAEAVRRARRTAA